MGIDVDPVLLNCINEVYEDESFSAQLLNIVKRLPDTFEMTWATFGHSHISGQQSNTAKWNLLKEKLIELGLIEEGARKRVRITF